MRVKPFALAALAAALLAGTAGSATAAGEMTFASWGGALQKAERDAWLNIIEKDLGITIKEDTTNGIADIRTQVQSGNVTWDVSEQGSNTCALLAKEGALEPLDYSVINTDGIPPQLVNKYWIANLYFASVMAWNTETVKTPPQSWADFFDTEKFPGARSMYRKPYYNLEAALMADGVPPDKVYPIDADRAFKMLDKIKPKVLTWWQSGAQSAQLMKDGEVDMALIWNGRVQAVMKEGAKADLTFNQQILDFDCLLVPKGAPNKELAMKVIAKIVEAPLQARLPMFINYGPINDKAYDLTDVLPPEKAKGLPNSPETRKSALILNSQWWVENQDKMQQRFDLWVQQ